MERFIDTVRRYPCLWNTAAIEYRDQELKDAAWAEVMKETDLSSVKEVKQKWKKLRDSYRDALKRASEAGARGAGAAEGGRRAAPWRHAARMHFLLPHMAGRKKTESPPPAAAPPAPVARSSDSEPEDWEPAPRRRRLSPALAPAPRDALRLFFEGMCEATRRLPAHAQISVKRSLFSSVMAAEEAALAAGGWPHARAGSSSGSDAAPC